MKTAANVAHQTRFVVLQSAEEGLVVTVALIASAMPIGQDVVTTQGALVSMISAAKAGGGVLHPSCACFLSKLAIEAAVLI